MKRREDGIPVAIIVLWWLMVLCFLYIFGYMAAVMMGLVQPG